MRQRAYRTQQLGMDVTGDRDDGKKQNTFTLQEKKYLGTS